MIYHEVKPTSELAQLEVFGPVLAAMPFDTEEEAIRLANGTDYGSWRGLVGRAISARSGSLARCGPGNCS